MLQYYHGKMFKFTIEIYGLIYNTLATFHPGYNFSPPEVCQGVLVTTFKQQKMELHIRDGFILACVCASGSAPLLALARGMGWGWLVGCSPQVMAGCLVAILE